MPKILLMVGYCNLYLTILIYLNFLHLTILIFVKIKHCIETSMAYLDGDGGEDEQVGEVEPGGRGEEHELPALGGRSRPPREVEPRERRRGGRRARRRQRQARREHLPAQAVHHVPRQIPFSSQFTQSAQIEG